MTFRNLKLHRTKAHAAATMGYDRRNCVATLMPEGGCGMDNKLLSMRQKRTDTELRERARCEMIDLAIRHFKLMDTSVETCYQEIHDSAEKILLTLPSELDKMEAQMQASNTLCCLLEPSIQHLHRARNLEMFRVVTELQNLIEL